MTIGELKKLLSKYPDDTSVGVTYEGTVDWNPTVYEENGILYIEAG